jgi:hypothetical protein
VLYAGKKARYRVIWVRYPGDGGEVLAAVHRIAPDECPWLEVLGKEHDASAFGSSHAESLGHGPID